MTRDSHAWGSVMTMIKNVIFDENIKSKKQNLSYLAILSLQIQSKLFYIDITNQITQYFESGMLILTKLFEYKTEYEPILIKSLEILYHKISSNVSMFKFVPYLNQCFSFSISFPNLMIETHLLFICILTKELLNNPSFTITNQETTFLMHIAMHIKSSKPTDEVKESLKSSFSEVLDLVTKFISQSMTEKAETINYELIRIIICVMYLIANGYCPEKTNLSQI